MARLDPSVKMFIVQSLARFESPSKVIEEVRSRFKLEVSPQQMLAYNPSTVAGARMSAELKALFAETRAKFKADLEEIPAANQAVRVAMLSRAAEKAERSGNVALMAQLLEQAAKEIGGAYTNRRELTGANGKPLLPSTPTEMTDDQLAGIAAGGGG